MPVSSTATLLHARALVFATSINQARSCPHFKILSAQLVTTLSVWRVWRGKAHVVCNTPAAIVRNTLGSPNNGPRMRNGESLQTAARERMHSNLPKCTIEWTVESPKAVTSSPFVTKAACPPPPTYDPRTYGSRTGTVQGASYHTARAQRSHCQAQWAALVAWHVIQCPSKPLPHFIPKVTEPPPGIGWFNGSRQAPKRVSRALIFRFLGPSDPHFRVLLRFSAALRAVQVAKNTTLIHFGAGGTKSCVECASNKYGIHLCHASVGCMTY